MSNSANSPFTESAQQTKGIHPARKDRIRGPLKLSLIHI